MGSPSYMRSVVDRNVVMRRMSVVTPVRRPRVRNCVLVLAANSEPQVEVLTHLESGFVMNTCIMDIPGALFLELTLKIRRDIVLTHPLPAI